MEKVTDFLSSQWMIIEIILAALLIVFVVALAIVAAVKNKKLKKLTATRDANLMDLADEKLKVASMETQLDDASKKFDAATLLHKNELDTTKKEYENSILEKERKFKEEVEKLETEKHGLEVHVSDLEAASESNANELDATKDKLAQEKTKTAELSERLEKMESENEMNVAQIEALQTQLKKALETPVIEHRLVLEKQLYTLKRDELLDIAREIRLTNYSKLKVDDLIAAIIKDQERLVK